MSSTSLGEYCTLGAELHAALKTLLRASVLGDSNVVGGNSRYRTVLVVENLRGSKPRIYFNSQALGLNKGCENQYQLGYQGASRQTSILTFFVDFEKSKFLKVSFVNSNHP